MRLSSAAFTITSSNPKEVCWWSSTPLCRRRGGEGLATTLRASARKIFEILLAVIELSPIIYPMNKYNVFHRTWWKENPSWPDGREPGAGEKHYLAENVSRQIALAICAEWNAENEPGPLSDKAEFEEA